MRTYDRKTYEAARDAWAWGRFGSEWNELKRIAWERGFPYPPAGTEHDDRDDEEPSQRAIVYRALLDRPRSTLSIASSSRSWSEIVRRIISEEGAIREAVGLDEDDAAWVRRSELTRDQATLMLRDILRKAMQPKEATE